jgi:hypothetical protein
LNAGGLTIPKRVELERILFREDIDAFCIQQANLTEDSNITIKGYSLYIHPKARRIASGILAGVKEELQSTLKIVKEMDDNDKLEVAKLEIWKNEEHYKIFTC